MVYSFKIEGGAAAIRADPGLLVKSERSRSDASDKKEKHLPSPFTNSRPRLIAGYSGERKLMASSITALSPRPGRTEEELG
jgi:hypothetical protein